MKSINRWMYGPTPEEKVRDWQAKLRKETRQLDREVLNVSHDHARQIRPRSPLIWH